MQTRDFCTLLSLLPQVHALPGFSESQTGSRRSLRNSHWPVRHGPERQGSACHLPYMAALPPTPLTHSTLQPQSDRRWWAAQAWQHKLLHLHTSPFSSRVYKLPLQPPAHTPNVPPSGQNRSERLHGQFLRCLHRSTSYSRAAGVCVRLVNGVRVTSARMRTFSSRVALA